MPSNPYKDQRECFNLISKLLTTKLSKEGISYKTLLRECLTQFAISEKAIKEFVRVYFIEDNLIIIEDGTIYPKEEVKT